MTNQTDISRESGGKTKVILVTRVHKEATDEKMPKLIDEIKMLENIPEEWRIHFPKIVFSEATTDKVYYEMPHYDLPTIRRLLFSGIFDHRDILNWIDTILDFCFEMYRREVVSIPKTYYMDCIHFARVRRRLRELSRKVATFKELIDQRIVIINGQEYINIPTILEELADWRAIPRVFPEFISKWAHSDLHFSNILVDIGGDNFILIDPRGYPFCDYYYDYGKLWHSVNGKYEFIAESKFTLDGGDFEIDENAAYHECEKIKEGLGAILCKYSSESKDVVLMKTEFNEAMHFASVAPFLLDFDGREERALVAYYTGVCLLNQFVEKYL